MAPGADERLPILRGHRERWQHQQNLQALPEERGKTAHGQEHQENLRFPKGYSADQRIRVLDLRADRADVIIPASEIYLSVMKWAGYQKIYVPQIGPPNGMVHRMYESYRQNGSELRR